MARLILTFGDKVLSNHMVALGAEMIIGRDASCQIVIDHPSVSSRHARVKQDDSGLFLTDLGSTNGTFVNDDKVVDCQLAHQDWIRVGKHILMVDLYETLSLDATVQMLAAGSTGASDADGTLMLDMQGGPDRSAWAQLDYLDLLSEDQPDFELSHRTVTIGKNKDADIVITGFWALFAGQPAATISKHEGDYVLDYVSGMIKPKLNGMTVLEPTRLNHHDIIRVGPVELQLYLAQ
jgi:pSer/pThr/pTyr-binding forkhead associated (FHA) protein